MLLFFKKKMAHDVIYKHELGVGRVVERKVLAFDSSMQLSEVTFQYKI
jgi:hypothetical protein